MSDYFDSFEVGLSQYRGWLDTGRILTNHFCDVTCGGYVVVSLSSAFGCYFAIATSGVIPRALRYFCDEFSACAYALDSLSDDMFYLMHDGGSIACDYEVWHIVEDSPETVFSDPVVGSFKIVPCKKRDFLFYVSFGSIRVLDFLCPEHSRYCLVRNGLDGTRTVFGCDDDISVLVPLRNLLIHIDGILNNGLCGDYSVYRLDD